MTQSAEAESIELRWQVDERELMFAYAVSWRRETRRRDRSSLLSNLLPMLAIVAGVVAALGLLRLAASGTRGADWAIAGALASALLFAANAWRRRRAYWRRYFENVGPLPYEQSLRLEAGVLALDSVHGSSLVPLHRIATSEERLAHVLLYFRSGAVLAVPAAAFADAQERAWFLRQVRAGRRA